MPLVRRPPELEAHLPQKASSCSGFEEKSQTSTILPSAMRRRSMPGWSSLMPSRWAANSISMATRSPLARKRWA